MSNVENLEDHMAFSCECGCVRFNLLKSGGIECDDCGEKIDSTWGLAQPEQEPVALPDDFELLPVDPTPEMKSAAIEVELFDHDTGKDYMLSWEEAEQIYSAMLNAAPTPPQRTWVHATSWRGLTDEDWDYLNKYCGSIRSAIQTAETLLKEKNT